jgi:hypothetical protein
MARVMMYGSAAVTKSAYQAQPAAVVWRERPRCGEEKCPVNPNCSRPFPPF